MPERMTRLSPSPALPGRLLRAGALLAPLALLGGCGGGTPLTFDLAALPGQARAGTAARSIVVSEPVGLQPMEADRIIVREPGGSSPSSAAASGPTACRA
ncbi:hypothetical protein GCM10025880_36750 [Methylorubrum aminovorans]|nr:hypothetical protein GCM10025880_36750 [Methylorubrum aminovorans]